MAPTRVIYNEADIKKNFNPSYLQRGRRYYQEERVRQYRIIANPNDQQQQLIQGKVRGSGRKTYDIHADVTLSTDHNVTTVDFDCHCTCPVGYDCKHAVALLLCVASLSDYQSSKTVQEPPSAYDVLRKQAQSGKKSETTTAASFTQWASELALRQKTLSTRTSSNEVILYFLDVMHYRTYSKLVIKIVLSRVLKKGGYGATKRYSKTSTVAQRATTQEDKRLIALMDALSESELDYNGTISISLKDADTVLTDLLKTQRVFWHKLSVEPLSLGDEKKLTTQWDIQDDGRQQLHYHIEGVPEEASVHLLPVTPLWYCNADARTCGPLKSELPAYALLSLLMLPPIEPNAVKTVQKQLTELLPQTEHLPVPVSIKTVKKAAKAEHTVTLHLFGHKTELKGTHYYSRVPGPILAFADIQFLYAGRSISLNEPATTLSSYQDGQLLDVKRDMPWEQHCVEKLMETDIAPFTFNTQYAVSDKLKFSFLLNESDDDDEVILTKLANINRIAAENHWRVVIDDSFPVQMIDEIDEWYSDLDDEGSGIDWFSLTLGVIVNGEKVNLLPLLVDLIRHRFRQLDSKTIAELPDDTACPLKLETGHYISVPFPRIRNILLVLCELFDDKPLDEDGALRLSQLQAGLLIEIEKAMGATQLRWFGGERLRRFAQKLTNFAGIKTVKPAKTLTATLRPYQQQGLNWMQFLREYELGGILADDMGLGKTIQTLAHFGVEKAGRRLKKPSLLVVPTSLVNNWAMEAERFSPNLSVLILHGSDRKARFSDIEKANIVITTYPLIFRDKDILLAHDYYYVILDEAQFIKNAKAKVTQILLQIQAQHRLCLTGTPMENHLGELWSLFNFVLPGLLGGAKRFKEVFRTPIERHGDGERHQQLVTRIKPFMLRRRKDDVVKELPKKTEMVRSIEIDGAQRDLYESVRLSMERHVRDAVSQKGLNRSQIVILDALLKLRQICCAPSLLKLKTVKKNVASAKLDDLMTFLPSLLEEGRRVLLFSSFTSMLALIEAELTKNNIPYVKLTGQTRDRKTPIAQFQGGEVPLFLISLKAGGVGLNLTAADTVIHYDPWWNPASEQQATDRAHRIGQTKPVFVYKLITKGTVEEKILEMQAKKRALIAGIVEQKVQKKVQLTHDDLNALFQPIG